MRKFLSLFAKNVPLLTKKIVFFTALYAQQSIYLCMSSGQGWKNNINSIESKTIKIFTGGRLIGQAYCFTGNYLVAISEQLLEPKNNNQRYEYYIGEEKLKGSFKVVGAYQNLVFIECTLSDKITPISGDLSHTDTYSRVQIIKKKEFMSLKEGYFITRDSGYGIIDGEGEVGSLVIGNDGVKGITVQVGSQQLRGFLRIIQWRHLDSIISHIKGKPLHLGISAQAVENHEGVSVVRVAPNSPFKHEIMMGDLILSANGHSFRDPDSLHRICMESEGEVKLIILREGKQVEEKVHF